MGMNNNTAPTVKCDSRTRTGAPCKRTATIAQPATAFTSALNLCKAHDAINTREWLATMNAYTR